MHAADAIKNSTLKRKKSAWPMQMTVYTYKILYVSGYSVLSIPSQNPFPFCLCMDIFDLT